GTKSSLVAIRPSSRPCALVTARTLARVRPSRTTSLPMDWQSPAAARSTSRAGRQKNAAHWPPLKNQRKPRRNRSAAKEPRNESRDPLQKRSDEEKGSSVDSVSWVAAALQSRRHSLFSSRRCRIDLRASYPPDGVVDS